MTLDSLEFIRRFSLHVLPKGFVRIRHYGILSSSAKDKSLTAIKEQLPGGVTPPESGDHKAAGGAYSPKQCPCSKKETMETLMRFHRRGPPPNWKELATDLLTCIKPVDYRHFKISCVIRLVSVMPKN